MKYGRRRNGNEILVIRFNTRSDPSIREPLDKGT